MYFGIPSKIVNKMRLMPSSYLLVDLVDESIIVIKKLYPQFSRTETVRIQNYNDKKSQDNKKINDTSVEIPDDDFKNPLDEIDDI